jgi:hypothetical protein
MVGEDLVNGDLVAHVVGEVHVDCIRADVWILCRVHSLKELVFDEHRAVCRGQRGESEWALKFLTRRGVVEVDGVSVKDVVAVSCHGAHILVEFAGVEGGVVVVADGEGDRVRGRRL